MNEPTAESTVLHSAIGSIEYALQGEGVPILVAHGAAGGFDQGLLVASPLAAQGYQLVAPSRDGYLRSPIGRTSSPQSQADKYALLLDHLGIDRCVILGVSVGGPSAIEFALRHSPRCRALVLISSIVASTAPAYLSILPERVLLSFLRGRAYRFLQRSAPDPVLLRVLGLTADDHRMASSDPLAADALAQVLLAARDLEGRRTLGSIADTVSARHLPHYPFAAITVPAIGVHGSKDRFAPLTAIADVMATIPQGQLHVVKGAGHLCCITHRPQVFSLLTGFLRTSII